MLPFPLGLQGSTAIAADSAIVFLRKPPPSHRREMEGKERQILLTPLERYPHFFVPPLRRQASFWTFVWGMSLNKTRKLCHHHRLWTAATSARGSDEGASRGLQFLWFSHDPKQQLFVVNITSRGRSRFPQGAPVAPRQLPYDTWSQSSYVWQCCRVSWRCYFLQDPI